MKLNSYVGVLLNTESIRLHSFVLPMTQGLLPQVSRDLGPIWSSVETCCFVVWDFLLYSKKYTLKDKKQAFALSIDVNLFSQQVLLSS